MRVLVVVLAVLAAAVPCLAAPGLVGVFPPVPGDGGVLAAERSLLGLCLADPSGYLDAVVRCLEVAPRGADAWREFSLGLDAGTRARYNALVVPGLPFWDARSVRRVCWAGLGWESVLPLVMFLWEGGVWCEAGD
ncbi:MAG: hypothetical protein QME87_13720 [Bacillota bacterium]|nr:hypothetical protein [Bacillota bacterium]